MNDWNTGKPKKDGVYIVNSTWSVRVASYSKDFGDCFQDIASNQSEGMPDWSGFLVVSSM